MPGRGFPHSPQKKGKGASGGFNLNRRRLLDATILNPFSYTLNRGSLTARVEVPALLPGINFTPQGNYSFYRVVAVLG
jgi:hypothetical protein